MKNEIILNSSIHIKKPPKAITKISRFVGEAKWPFFRVKKDEAIK